MKHIIVDQTDVPPPPPAYDRRRTPDRRTIWRGGRRDSDWIDRPLGGLDRLEREAKRSAWRRVLSTLHIW
jgi:hypothetical protein